MLNKLNIYTGMHTKEFMNWCEDNKLEDELCEIRSCDDGYFVELECNEKFKKFFPILFEDVILSKNPITKNHETLKSSIKNIVFSPCRDDINNTFLSFLEDNTEISLEGYINFRMNEYVHLVNLVLYAIIKRSL